MTSFLALADFELVESAPIAVGGFATVFHARYQGTDVALKCIRKATGSDESVQRARVLRELAVHSKLRHDRVLAMVPPGFFESDDSAADAGCLYIVTEYCSNGDVLSFMRRRAEQRKEEHVSKPIVKDDGMSVDEARQLFRQLAEGVAYLHSQGIIHRDIKLKNLLLTGDMQLKIGDFGLAAEFTPDDTDCYTVCGTPATAAPEMTPGRSHDTACDVWSMGCVLFTMLTGRSVLARRKHDESAATRTLSSTRTLRPDFDTMLARLPSTAQFLLRQMLQYDPTKRPTAREVLRSEFVIGAASLPIRVPPPVAPVSAPVASTVSPPRLASPVRPLSTAYTHHRMPSFTATASMASSASVLSVTEDLADEELSRVRAQRIETIRYAREKQRTYARAYASGTGQDGDLGAQAVLSLYRAVEDVELPSSSVLIPDDEHSRSLDIMSMSLPSLSSTMTPGFRSSKSGGGRHSRSRRTHRKPVSGVTWSGRTIPYRFGAGSDKAAAVIVGPILLAAAAASGVCIRLCCDTPSKVWIGRLVSGTASFAVFRSLCETMHPDVPDDHMPQWCGQCAELCGVDVHDGSVMSVLSAQMVWQSDPLSPSSLSSSQRQLFRYACHIITALSAKVPKVVQTVKGAKYMLMDNWPMPDFKYTSADGVHSVAISTREDTAVIVQVQPEGAPKITTVAVHGFTSTATTLSDDVRTLLADAQVAHMQCLLQHQPLDGTAQLPPPVQ